MPTGFLNNEVLNLLGSSVVFSGSVPFLTIAEFPLIIQELFILGDFTGNQQKNIYKYLVNCWLNSSGFT